MRTLLKFLMLSLLFVSCKEAPQITTTSSQARRLYDVGLDHLRKFHYPEAKLALDSALHLDPNFVMAYARLAYVHMGTGDEDSARLLARAALQRLGEVSRYEQLYVRLLDHLANYRNAEAAATADSLITLFPSDAEVYVLRGNLLERDKQFEPALEMYQKALSVDSSYAPAAMSLGYAYSAQGDADGALKAMERYIHLVPDDADPRASYADVLLRMGKYTEALEQYQKSLELKPDYWYSINRIADVYTILGRLSEASKQYAIGLSKMVLNNQTRSNYVAMEAELAMRRGHFEDALRMFDQSLTLDSLGLRPRYGRAFALAKLGRFLEAYESLAEIRRELERRNLTASMAMLDYHALQARLLEEEGKVENAFAACDSALLYGAAISRAEIFNIVARLYFKTNEYEHALDALEEALRYNPNSPRALLTLTKVYQALGDRAMTAEIGRRLAQLWSKADNDFTDYIELKQLLARSGIRV